MRPLRFEMVDDEMAQILRSKTGAERLRIANDMFATARRMIESYLTTQHPDWSPEEIQKEVARRISHRAICDGSR
jgi:hypothetical protein